MAVFTRVTEQDISAWLSDYSLGSLLELQGIPAGIENTNYFVDCGGTDGHLHRYVLTLFERLTAEQLPFYLRLMQHLAQRGVPVPEPHADAAGEILFEVAGKPAAIVDRLHGGHQLAPDAFHCEQVGATLARMHLAGRDFTMHQPNLRGLAWWEQVTPQILPFLDGPQAELLQSELAFQQQVAASAEYAHLQAELSGPIHADLFRDNVLLDGERVGGLIDFYFACNDCLLYDVAITVNDWCVAADGVLDTERTRAFLQAYHATRPFSAQEAASWPTALRVAALRFWISRLFDLHLPREGEIVNAHNPDQFKRILQRHIATGSNTAWL